MIIRQVSIPRLRRRAPTRCLLQSSRSLQWTATSTNRRASMPDQSFAIDDAPLRFSVDIDGGQNIVLASHPDIQSGHQEDANDKVGNEAADDNDGERAL